jgi:hypothetical protein
MRKTLSEITDADNGLQDDAQNGPEAQQTAIGKDDLQAPFRCFSAEPVPSDASGHTGDEHRHAKQNDKRASEGSRTDPDKGQPQAENPDLPADLQQIVDAWPHLPDPIRKAMLALVESSR